MPNYLPDNPQDFTDLLGGAYPADQSSEEDPFYGIDLGTPTPSSPPAYQELSPFAASTLLPNVATIFDSPQDRMEQRRKELEDKAFEFTPAPVYEEKKPSLGRRIGLTIANALSGYGAAVARNPRLRTNFLGEQIAEYQREAREKYARDVDTWRRTNAATQERARHDLALVEGDIQEKQNYDKSINLAVDQRQKILDFAKSQGIDIPPSEESSFILTGKIPLTRPELEARERDMAVRTAALFGVVSPGKWEADSRAALAHYNEMMEIRRMNAGGRGGTDQGRLVAASLDRMAKQLLDNSKKPVDRMVEDYIDDGKGGFRLGWKKSVTYVPSMTFEQARRLAWRSSPWARKWFPKEEDYATNPALNALTVDSQGNPILENPPDYGVSYPDTGRSGKGNGGPEPSMTGEGGGTLGDIESILNERKSRPKP